MKKFSIPEGLKSRKFLLSVALSAVVFANRFFQLGLTPDDVNKIALAVVTYIIAEGGADIVSRAK